MKEQGTGFRTGNGEGRRRPAGGRKPAGEHGKGRMPDGFRPPVHAGRDQSRSAPAQGDRGKHAVPAGKGRPGPSARDVALRALDDVIRSGAYAAQAVDRQLAAGNLIPEDRRLAAGIFYAAVENRLRIESVLSPFIRNEPLPIVRDILHIACAQILFLDRIPDHAAVDEAVRQTRRFARAEQTGFVNVVLRNVIRARDAGELPEPPEDDWSRRYSLNEDLVRVLRESLPAQTAEAVCAFRPTDHRQTVRPNLMTVSDEELVRYLAAQGIDAVPGLVPHAFRCARPGALSELEGYRKGMYSIQGESSMLAAMAVGAKPGMNLLDACAAPGGKTAFLCETMQGTGRVYAWDLHAHRVELIRAAGRRLKLYNLRTAVRDAAEPYPSFDGLMDAVLVDAPCSGLGVMADKPDLRLRFNAEEARRLPLIQRGILRNCASFVKVGGLLVYSTCTILPEENEERVREFLQENPNFALETGEEWLPEALRGKMRDGMLQLYQHRDGVEGFFIARMRRRCL